MQLDDVQLAAQQQFARRSHHYGQGHILEEVEDLREALTLFSLPPEAKVLDVATGGGHAGLFFASLGCDVTLSDIAQPMLDNASKAAAARGLKVQLAQHPAEKFPHANGAFDLVVCRVAAHHFSFPEHFIAESARVLKNGGSFLLIDLTVAEDEPEAEAWLHAVEKARDASHHRFLTPRTWTVLCRRHGLNTSTVKLLPFKQPDLNWYFETAATPDENRIKVLELIAHAPDSVRRLFQLGEEDGKIIWWWQKMFLHAIKE